MVGQEEPTICLPSGEKATHFTEPAQLMSDLTSWPPAASQMQIKESEEHDAICLPSGEKVADFSQLIW
jgi:hypothetical protein